MLSLVACACKLPPLLGASSWESRARAGETSGTGIRWPHCYSERMRDSERGELWQFGDYDHQRLEAKKSSLNPDGYLRAKTLIHSQADDSLVSTGTYCLRHSLEMITTQECKETTRAYFVLSAQAVSKS